MEQHRIHDTLEKFWRDHFFFNFEFSLTNEKKNYIVDRFKFRSNDENTHYKQKRNSTPTWLYVVVVSGSSWNTSTDE